MKRKKRKEFDKEDILQLLRDLNIDRVIEDAHLLLDLNRDGKWSIRLLLLSYLLKENELQTIREFVDFGFSKIADDSLFQRFNFKKIRSTLAMPEKWFTDEGGSEYIPGSGNARSILSKRTDLFTKIGSRYVLNEKNGSRDLALVLFIFLLKARGIDLEKIPDADEVESGSVSEGTYRQLFLIDSTGKPTSLSHKVQDIVEDCPVLIQAEEFDKDTKNILPHIQRTILDLLQRHHSAFTNPPHKRKLAIICKPIYSLPARSKNEEFTINSLLTPSTSEKEHSMNGVDGESIEDSDTNPVLLTGSAGSGKSFWMIKLALDLWNHSFKSGSPNRSDRVIPLFIGLGSVFLDKTKHGESLVYGEEKATLWHIDEPPDEIPRRSLIDRFLGAMLKKSPQYIRKILDRVDWHEVKFVFLLDGWDELGRRERKEMIRLIKSSPINQLPCIISSRNKDSDFDSIEIEHIRLEKPTIDNCKDYLRSRGMEEEVLDKVKEWFPDPSPLDLEILGRVPKMEEISSGRVPVYRTWIELQILSSIRSDILQDLRSRSQIDTFIEGEFFRDKSLKDWIRSRNNSHSVWRCLPYIAYLQKDGLNTSLSYDQVVQDNPLLKEFLEKRYGSGDSPHPEISRNNLVPYLSAEYVFRSYLSGKYPPIRGDLQTFRFLVEILSYDLERRHDRELIPRSAELTPLQTAAMICLQGESEAYTNGARIRPFIAEGKSGSTPFYTALFDGFVKYWSQTSTCCVRRNILDAFTKLIRTFIVEEKEGNPAQFIVPLLEIEQAFDSNTFSKLITEEPDTSVDLEICDSSGYTLYYLDYEKVQDWLLQLSVKKPWLTPWTVRVVKQENRLKIRDIIDEAPDEWMIYEVLNYVTSGFTSIDSEWFESIHRNALRLESDLLWNSIAIGLQMSRGEIDDYRFSKILEVLGSPCVEERWKFGLIVNLGKVRLPERYTREVWRSTEQGKIGLKYGIALCLSQELPDIAIDDILDAIRDSEGSGWLRLLLPGILQEEYDEEEINSRFVQLSYTIVQAITRVRVVPWDEARLNSLIDMWWDSNLKTLEDALSLIKTISKKRRENQLAILDWRETEALKRLVVWLGSSRKSTKKKFFRKLIESEIDMTDFSVREHLYPIYQEIDNRTDLDELLVARYPLYHCSISILPLSRESWLTHIDKVDREELLESNWLMEIYLEAGNVATIDGAISLLNEIQNQSDYLIETFDSLVKWVLQRPTDEIAPFILQLLKENPATTRMGYWRRVKESGLIKALVPVSKNSPEVYTRILEIAKEIPGLQIDKRSELQFLFEALAPDDQMRVVRAHFERFVGKESFFFGKTLEEIILIHGNKNDVDSLVRSLNKEPRNLGNIWSKNPERATEISKRLSNPFSCLLYEIDMIGGWAEYKRELEKNPKKVEKDLLLFLKNDWIHKGYEFLVAGGVLREVALKHWKRIFQSDKASRNEIELYLGALFEPDDDEIVEYVASEVDEIHRNLKEREKEIAKAYRTPWYSWNIPVLDKIQNRHGYTGLKRLLMKVKDQYSIEGVMTYLVKSAKKEGIPKSEIVSLDEYLKLSRAIRWHLMKEYED